MDGPGSEILSPQPPDRAAHADAVGGNGGGGGSGVAEEITLHDLVAQLEQDPGECLRAFHGLESIEEATRLRIIEGLASSAGGPGVSALLRLLASSGDEATRRAALIALGEPDAGDGGQEESLQVKEPFSFEEPTGQGLGSSTGRSGTGPARELVRVGDLFRPRLVQCLVTAVDGAGRGSIALSASLDAHRSTAVFLCDVENGVTDAIGQVEKESPEAGGLLREVRAQAGGLGVEGVPDLALGLLAGSYMLSARVDTAGGGRMARAYRWPGLQASTVDGAGCRLGCQADEQCGIADSRRRGPRRLPCLAGQLAADVRPGGRDLPP